jgi:uncharacterized damage-inducible protein DinB
MTPDSSALFVSFSGKKLRQLHSRIEDCLARLDDAQLWARPSESANSAGNLCLHLAGNVRQWILHGVGGAPDTRARDAEFAARGGASRDELRARLGETMEEALAVIERQTAEDLARAVRPQNYEVTVLEAIYHVVEHFAQHTGQIIYIAKAATGVDLGYYAHLSRPAPQSDPTP